MSRALTPPSVGQPISASFFAELLREVRANRPLPGQNVRTSRTPNGTHISATGTSAHSSPSVLPWSFSCAEAEDPDNPGETVRTGGWTNCRLQLGYVTGYVSPDLATAGTPPYLLIGGTDETADGWYYVECDFGAGSATIVRHDAGEDVRTVEPENDLVRIWIGEVHDGKLLDNAPHVNPVAYAYA